MAPKRSNKGKQIMEVNNKDTTAFKLPAVPSLVGQRVVFSKKIALMVSPTNTEDLFEPFFIVSKKSFNYIRSMVRDHMNPQATQFYFKDGNPMSTSDQVAIALRRLSTVDSSLNLAALFDTNRQTVNEITCLFVEALVARGRQHISWPLDIEQTKSTFQRIGGLSTGGLPNCCGAIETTHLKMHLHEDKTEPKVWQDQANNYSMKLQAIVDPAMRFVDVFCGVPGSMRNDYILQGSEFFKLAQKGERLNGNEIKLSEGTKVREYLVGGSSFQLLPWLITPFQDAEMTRDQIKFNHMHLATRRVAKRALKKLKDNWAAIDGSMWQPDRHKLPLIAVACCILHNIQIEIGGDGTSSESEKFDHDPEYPQETSGLADTEAVVVRDKICLYLAEKLED